MFNDINLSYDNNKDYREESFVQDRIFLFSFGLFYFVVTFFFFSFLSFPYRCNVEEDFKGRVTF